MRPGTSSPRDGMRRQRDALGLTQEQVALSLGVAVSTYQGWELGKRRITLGFRPRLAEVLQVTMTDVAGWFDPASIAPDGLTPTWLGTLAALEQGAADMWSYEPVVVPGLLQTAAYAAAVERQAITSLTDAEVEKWVNIRLARQGVLTREPDPLRLSVVLDESVLRRLAGNREIMADQLDHLATMAAQSNIDVRVLPLVPGTHVAAFGAFTLLTTPGAANPYMLTIEDRGGAHYLEWPEKVAAHTELFEHLRDVALSPADSIDLFRSTAQEHRT